MADGLEVTKIAIDDMAIAQRLTDILNDEFVMWDVHFAFYEIITPYVPYDTGYLCGDTEAHSVSIQKDGITYHADYAAEQYYGTTIHHKKEKHPLATAYWDKVAMQTHKDEFTQKVKDIIVMHLKKEQEGDRAIG